MSQSPETQLMDTQAIMHELSTDSEVTFRKVLGSAEILHARPGIDSFEETRPMYTSMDSSSQLTSITTSSPSVVVTRMPPRPVASSYIFGSQPTPGSTTSNHTVDPTTLQLYSVVPFMFGLKRLSSHFMINFMTVVTCSVHQVVTAAVCSRSHWHSAALLHCSPQSYHTERCSGRLHTIYIVAHARCWHAGLKFLVFLNQC